MQTNTKNQFQHIFQNATKQLKIFSFPKNILHLENILHQAKHRHRVKYWKMISCAFSFTQPNMVK